MINPSLGLVLGPCARLSSAVLQCRQLLFSSRLFATTNNARSPTPNDAAQRTNNTLNDKLISGYGNVYATEIKRKRQVPDISLPNFEQVECLKWTTWKMLRDVKRRHIVASHWQYKLNLLNIGKCRTLPSEIRDQAIEERNSLPRDSRLNRLTNRCSLTSRARGKLIKYRLSRIVWRDMADHGLISGQIRAKW